MSVASPRRDRKQGANERVGADEMCGGSKHRY